jgi:polyhydroxyalkanoate synthase
VGAGALDVYAVTMLDLEQKDQLGAFSSPSLVSFARRRCCATGSSVPATLAVPSPGCGPTIWCSTTYRTITCSGARPRRFDILAWNADGTNLPGALHAQFLDFFRDNLLAAPHATTVLGTPGRSRNCYRADLRLRHDR